MLALWPNGTLAWQYYRARYYDPTVGRFISEDPIRYDYGRSAYSYVSNSPAGLVDPLGLASQQNCTGCDGKPNRSFEIAKSCCVDIAPVPSSAPNPYPDDYYYMGVSARFMFAHGGNGAWANAVRGCLECMYSHGTDPDPAHRFCYVVGWVRTSHLSALWGLGRAVEAATAFGAALNNPRPMGLH